VIGLHIGRINGRQFLYSITSCEEPFADRDECPFYEEDDTFDEFADSAAALASNITETTGAIVVCEPLCQDGVISADGELLFKSRRVNFTTTLY